MAKLEKKVTIDTTDKNDSKTDTTVKTDKLLDVNK